MVEQESGTPKSRFKIFMDKIKPEHKFLFFFQFVILGIIFFSTQSVPNTQYINVSDPLTVPLPLDKILNIYGEIPVDYAYPESQVVLYSKTDFVPQSSPSPFLLILDLIIIGTIILYSSNKEDDLIGISEEAARRIVLDRWKYLKKTGKEIGELDLYTPIPIHHTRTVELDNGKKVPYEIILSGKVTEPDGDPHFVRVGIHPINKSCSEFIKCDKPMDRKDLCPNCGEYSDTKPVTTEDYQELMKIIKLKK